jgi:hypothetical protein
MRGKDGIEQRVARFRRKIEDDFMFLPIGMLLLLDTIGCQASIQVLNKNNRDE